MLTSVLYILLAILMLSVLIVIHELGHYAVGRLCGIGVVDDERYAGLVVRHYAGKGYGTRRIREELFRRGIDPELRDAALAQLPSADDTVYRLLKNKLRGASAPEDLRRAQDALLRRGFSRGEVRAAVEHYLAQTEDTE